VDPEVLNVAKEAKNAIMALNRLKQSALRGDSEDEYVAAAKEASNTATELLITARHVFELKFVLMKLQIF
jgi:hypothetical protein